MFEDASFTASTLAYRLKCENKGCDQILCHFSYPAGSDPARLSEAAPEAKISMYTDGSVRYPQSLFSVATFRLFIPGCAAADIPSDMLHYASVVDIGELPSKAGIALGGVLGGLFHSSARAELAGLATGLLSPSAVNIGLDNMGHPEGCGDS